MKGSCKELKLGLVTSLLQSSGQELKLGSGKKFNERFL